MVELDGLDGVRSNSESDPWASAAQESPHRSWGEWEGRWSDAQWSGWESWATHRRQWRDSEPPPSYDGENPGDTYQKWRRMHRLWERSTDTPANKKGRRTLAVLKGTALTAALTLGDEELLSEEGPQAIVRVLDELYEPYAESRLAQSLPESSVCWKQRKDGRDDAVHGPEASGVCGATKAGLSPCPRWPRGWSSCGWQN